MCLLLAVTAMAQQKHKPVTPKRTSSHLQDFSHLAAEANVQFTFPDGFKEIRVSEDEDSFYDYALEIPGRGFEMWVMVRPQKGEWTNYERSRSDVNKQLANPDSLYIDISRAQASAFSGDQNFDAKEISAGVLTRYNASAGKSYILNMQDLPSTKQYKYALLLALRRDYAGTMLIVCFTNEKNAEFFRNVSRICKYLKFKP